MLFVILMFNQASGLEYQGEQYHFIKNIQGDIIGILDSDLNQIVTYEYDSWGKVISVKDEQGNLITDQDHIGNINPFRYRGYYYDVETELYYLNSRYYNPEWGRFINADAGIDNDHLLGANLYQYAYNNPINFSDPTGHLPKWLEKAIAITAIAVISVVAVAALVVAAPAVITAVSVYAGAVGISTATVATVVNIGVVAASTAIAINGVNRSNQVITGKNQIADNLMGGNEALYDNIEQGLFMVSAMAGTYSQMYGQYPSTGRSAPNNLKEQMQLNNAIRNPSMGTSFMSKPMSDPRMPAFMGWQKLNYPYEGGQIHAVGNKFIPFYFDFKIK